MWLERELWGAWLLLLVFAGLSGCSDGPQTGPVPVHFDRDTCTRCRMVLSDPRFVAEVRWFPAGKRSRIAKFDDIGCAVLWLAEQPFRDDPRVEIWVADYRTHGWIDARKAYYVKLNNSPMEYGLGAQSDPAPGALGFEQAKEHIREVEEKFNVHGQQLKQRLEEQARRRALLRQTEKP
ncbi:MAG: hypothetical protein D6720_09245 [Gammaproteobacteria bacterium]|nr:MAG: hypothetical protein D6720_09245 [Gammaproteobacteria bacterium]